MDRDDLLGTIKDGVNLAGKMAFKGVGEVAKAVKSAAPSGGKTADTGLYFQRHLQPRFGDFVPAMEFQEVQAQGNQIVGLLKNITVPAAERAFASGIQALLTGGMGQARDRFMEAVAKDAQFADAYFLAGCAALSLKDYDRASDVFQKALLCQSNLGNRIRKYLGSMRMSLCISENSTLSLFPDLLGLNALAVTALRGQGRLEEAVRMLDQLQGIMPGHPLIVFYLACLHLEQGEYHKVLEKCQGITLDSNLHLAVLVLQARAYLSLGDPQPFMDMFRKLPGRTDLDPQLVFDVRHTLGLAYQQLGAQADAERELQAVRRLYPNYQDLLERIGLEGAEEEEDDSPPARPMKALPPRAAEPVATASSPPPPAPPPAAAAPAPVKRAPPTRVVTASEVPGKAWEGRLVTEDGQLTHPLTGEGVRIGRAAGDLQLPFDDSVSTNHARIYWEQSSYWVEDVGSTNGTWVNSHRLGSSRVELNRGDVVIVGRTRLRVE